jgi:TPR repeat protein
MAPLNRQGFSLHDAYNTPHRVLNIVQSIDQEERKLRSRFVQLSAVQSSLVRGWSRVRTRFFSDSIRKRSRATAPPFVLGCITRLTLAAALGMAGCDRTSYESANCADVSAAASSPRDIEPALLQRLQVCAERGHAESQHWLAWTYRFGEGTPRDYAMALKWYRKAAAQHDTEAAYALCQMYA